MTTREFQDQSTVTASTPTRHAPIPDFSPSAYVDTNYSPNTPQGPTSHHDYNENYGFNYADFADNEPFLPIESADQTTPLGHAHDDDDERTPVIPEHPPMPSSSYPQPNDKSLLSPFRPLHTDYPYDPNMYQAVTYDQPMYQPALPQYQQPMYIAPGQFYAPQYSYPGVPLSRGGSPSSSISSNSLVRSGSTSSELRPARPKVKLTFDDKKRIVEIARENTSLRQEDIARQYG
jgi:hypothetical protein